MNLADIAIGGISDGYFECYDNMETVSSVSGCNAISDLVDRNWSVIVNSDCYYG